MRTARITKVDALLAAAVVLMVSSPMLLTRSGFGEDFTNAMWMAWVAGKNLVQAGHPVYFANTTTLGAFYPLFAFYGGPLYTYTGAVSELLGGQAEVAFILLTMLAILGVYGSVLWLGREFGLRGLTAHAPALVAVTSAYYITNLYGRGDWTEFMATSSLAPLVASGVHLARSERWRAFPMAIFVASVVLLTSGHNITLLWGTTIGVAALLFVWLVQGAPRRLPYRRLAMLGGLGLMGALINAWYLLPDVTFAGQVAVAHAEPTSSAVWRMSKMFNLPEILLYPFRRVPSQSSTPALYVQAPDWFIVWGLLAAALLLRHAAVSRALRRLWVSMFVILVAILGMIMLKLFWRFVYYPFSEIIIPYRLCTYVFYATAGLVLIAALALQRVAARGDSQRTVRGLWTALAGVAAVSICLCVWQLWVPNTRFSESYANRSGALASATTMPASWYAIGDYSDWQVKLAVAPANRQLLIPPGAVQGDRFDAWMNVPAGSQPIQTNIAGGSYIVHIGGLRVVGRTREDLAVVKRIAGGSGPVHVVVETTRSTAGELGRTISSVTLLATFAVLAYAALRPRWARARSRARLEVSG
jgi:hypothetical protein